MESPDRGGPAKRQKPDYSDTITILVGPDEHSLTVHRDNICAHSRFFEAACSREWKEAKDKVVRLPEGEPETFRMYTHWVYTGNLDPAFMPEPIGVIITPSYLSLAKVWIFANFIGDDLLCNKAIDCTIEKSMGAKKRTTIDTFRYICEKTSEGSAIRRLHSDLILAQSQFIRIEDFGLDVLHEFVRSCAQSFLDGEMNKREAVTFENRCKYHIHVDGSDGCA